MNDTKAGYRRGVGILLHDARGRLWMGRRAGIPLLGYHFPQGGLRAGEEPEEGCLRELHEELGPVRATIDRMLDGWFAYEVPHELRPPSWDGRYVGQVQRWFVVRYEGDGRDIDLATHEDPEFLDGMWVEPREVLTRATPFKRAMYAELLAALGL